VNEGVIKTEYEEVKEEIVKGDKEETQLRGSRRLLLYIDGWQNRIELNRTE
jgi:hypothetical protein